MIYLTWCPRSANLCQLLHSMTAEGLRAKKTLLFGCRIKIHIPDSGDSGEKVKCRQRLSMMSSKIYTSWSFWLTAKRTTCHLRMCPRRFQNLLLVEKLMLIKSAFCNPFYILAFLALAESRWRLRLFYVTLRNCFTVRCAARHQTIKNGLSLWLRRSTSWKRWNVGRSSSSRLCLLAPNSSIAAGSTDWNFEMESTSVIVLDLLLWAINKKKGVTILKASNPLACTLPSASYSTQDFFLQIHSSNLSTAPFPLSGGHEAESPASDCLAEKTTSRSRPSGLCTRTSPTHTRTHIHTYTRTNTHTHTHTHSLSLSLALSHTPMHVYTHMYMHVYIQTYKHSLSWLPLIKMLTNLQIVGTTLPNKELSVKMIASREWIEVHVPMETNSNRLSLFYVTLRNCFTVRCAARQTIKNGLSLWSRRSTSRKRWDISRSSSKRLGDIYTDCTQTATHAATHTATRCNKLQLTTKRCNAPKDSFFHS